MMMVLITYDVSTEDNTGKTRLRKVAKECVNYGQRFYYIGNNYRDKIEYYGAKTSYDPEGLLMI